MKVVGLDRISIWGPKSYDELHARMAAEPRKPAVILDNKMAHEICVGIQPEFDAKKEADWADAEVQENLYHIEHGTYLWDRGWRWAAGLAFAYNENPEINDGFIAVIAPDGMSQDQAKQFFDRIAAVLKENRENQQKQKKDEGHITVQE